MEQLKNIKVSLEDARKWYKGHNETLKELAKKTFPIEDLNKYDYHKITTFEDACEALGVKVKINSSYPKQIQAYIQLHYILKALNLGYDINFSKGEYWMPLIKVIYQIKNIDTSDMTYINSVCIHEDWYNVFYDGLACVYGIPNLNKDGIYDNNFKISYLLACATPEIAEFLGLKFASLIVNILYGDFR